MPMDETQARVAIDLSGRPAMTFKGTFPTDHVGEFPAEMCPHVFESLAKHSGIGLVLTCKGDLDIDAHHTVEDCALALGTALKQALGDKAGIGRFGFVMPMDETQARVAIDLSGRPAMTFKGTFPTDHVGEFPAEMCPHVFESLAQTLGCLLYTSPSPRDATLSRMPSSA